MQAVPTPGSSLQIRFAFHSLIPERQGRGDTLSRKALLVFLSRPLCCFEATLGGQREDGWEFRCKRPRTDSLWAWEPGTWDWVPLQEFQPCARRQQAGSIPPGRRDWPGLQTRLVRRDVRTPHRASARVSMGQATRGCGLPSRPRDVLPQGGWRSAGPWPGGITPARKFRILAHTNPTRQRGL